MSWEWSPNFVLIPWWNSILKHKTVRSSRFSCASDNLPLPPNSVLCHQLLVKRFENRWWFNILFILKYLFFYCRLWRLSLFPFDSHSTNITMDLYFFILFSLSGFVWVRLKFSIFIIITRNVSKQSWGQLSLRSETRKYYRTGEEYQWRYCGELKGSVLLLRLKYL